VIDSWLLPNGKNDQKEPERIYMNWDWTNNEHKRSEQIESEKDTDRYLYRGMSESELFRLLESQCNQEEINQAIEFDFRNKNNYDIRIKNKANNTKGHVQSGKTTFMINHMFYYLKKNISSENDYY
jgi:hypothetical protein